MLDRRRLLIGLLAAPAIIRTPGLLMAIRRKSVGFEFTGFRSLVPYDELAEVMSQILRDKGLRVYGPSKTWVASTAAVFGA